MKQADRIDVQQATEATAPPDTMATRTGMLNTPVSQDTQAHGLIKDRSPGEFQRPPGMSDADWRTLEAQQGVQGAQGTQVQSQPIPGATAVLEPHDASTLNKGDGFDKPGGLDYGHIDDTT